MPNISVWGGTCKNVINGKPCDTKLMVRPSKNFGIHLDVPSTTRISKQKCPKCGFMNSFQDTELSEGVAELPQ
jgi:hypothetical protein